MSFQTEAIADLKTPKFAQVFRVAIPDYKLFAKTLQVNVWSVVQLKEQECLVSKRWELRRISHLCIGPVKVM